jgi:hypothetical protein
MDSANPTRRAREGELVGPTCPLSPREAGISFLCRGDACQLGLGRSTADPPAEIGGKDITSNIGEKAVRCVQLTPYPDDALIGPAWFPLFHATSDAGSSPEELRGHARRVTAISEFGPSRGRKAVEAALLGQRARLPFRSSPTVSVASVQKLSPNRCARRAGAVGRRPRPDRPESR